MSRPLDRWLETFMCGQYAETFEAYGYKTLQSVCQLDYQKLRVMGVMPEHCEKIMENVSVLQQSYMGNSGHPAGGGGYGGNPGAMNNSIPAPPSASMDVMHNPASTALVNVARNATHRGGMGYEGMSPSPPVPAGPAPYMNSTMGPMSPYHQQANPAMGGMMGSGYGSGQPGPPGGYYGGRPMYNQPGGSPQPPYPGHPMTPHMSQSGPPHMSQSGPPHMSQAGPPHMSQSGPPHMPQSAPQHMSQSGPPHMSQSGPPHMAQSGAPHITQSGAAQSGPMPVASPPGMQQGSQYNQYNPQSGFVPPHSPTFPANYTAPSSSPRMMSSPGSIFPIPANRDGSSSTPPNPPVHHHMRNSMRQNPQQIADSILQMASSTYPGGGPPATRGPHPLSRFNGPTSPHGPMSGQMGPHGQMGPDYMGQGVPMGPRGHMVPECQGGNMNCPPNMMPNNLYGMHVQQQSQYMSYHSGSGQMGPNCGSPTSPMQVRSPGSVHSNHSMPSTSPGPLRSPAPGAERSANPVSSPMAGMGSPSMQQQPMHSPMSCGSHTSMRSPMQGMPPPMSPHNHASPANMVGGMRSPAHYPNNSMGMMSGELMQPQVSYSCSTSAMYSQPSSSIYTTSNRREGGPNPLMSLQKLVMLPESQVVDPKSVVNDACLAEGKEDEKGDRRSRENDDILDNYIPDIKHEHSEFSQLPDGPYQSKNSHTRPPKPPDKSDQPINDRTCFSPNLHNDWSPSKNAEVIDKPKKPRQRKRKEKADKNDSTDNGESASPKSNKKNNSLSPKDPYDSAKQTCNNNNNEKSTQDNEKPSKKKKKIKTEVTVGRVEENVFLKNNIFLDKELPTGLEKVAKLIEKSKELPMLGLNDKPHNGKHLIDLGEIVNASKLKAKRLKAMVVHDADVRRSPDKLKDDMFSESHPLERNGESLDSPGKENSIDKVCLKSDLLLLKKPTPSNRDSVVKQNGNLTNGINGVDPYEFEDSLHSDFEQNFTVHNGNHSYCNGNSHNTTSSPRKTTCDVDTVNRKKSPIKKPPHKSLKGKVNGDICDTQQGFGSSDLNLHNITKAVFSKSSQCDVDNLSSQNKKSKLKKNVPKVAQADPVESASYGEVVLNGTLVKASSPAKTQSNLILFPTNQKKSPSKSRKSNAEDRDCVLRRLNGESACMISTPLSIDCSDPSPPSYPSSPSFASSGHSEPPILPSPNGGKDNNVFPVINSNGLLSIGSSKPAHGMDSCNAFVNSEASSPSKDISKSPKYSDPLSKKPAPDKERLLSPTKRKLAQKEYEDSVAGGKTAPETDHILKDAKKKAVVSRLSSVDSDSPNKKKKKKVKNSRSEKPEVKIESGSPLQPEKVGSANAEAQAVKSEIKEEADCDNLTGCSANLCDDIQQEVKVADRISLKSDSHEKQSNEEPQDKNEGPKSGGNQSGPQKEGGEVKSSSASQVTVSTRRSAASGRCPNASRDSSSEGSNKDSPTKNNRHKNDNTNNTHSTSPDTPKSHSNLPNESLSASKPQRKRKYHNFAILADRGASSDSDEDLYSLAKRFSKNSPKKKVPVIKKKTVVSKKKGEKKPLKVKKELPPIRIPSPVLSSPRGSPSRSSPGQSVVSISSGSGDIAIKEDTPPKLDSDDKYDQSFDQPSTSTDTTLLSGVLNSPGDPSKPKKRMGRPVGAKDKKVRKRKKPGDYDMDEDNKKIDQMKKAIKVKDPVKKFRNEASSIIPGPVIRMKGSRAAPISLEVINGHDVEFDKKKKRGEAQYEKTDSTTLSMTNAVPWVCAFCSKGPNFWGLGDLFGPYYIGGDNSPRKRRDSMSRSSDGKRRRTCSTSEVSRHAEEEARETWTHVSCAVWSHGVYLMAGKLHGLQDALAIAHQTHCSSCKSTGATLGCVARGCSQKYHYLCAQDKDCYLDEENFSLVCPKHKDKKLREAPSQQDTVT